MLETDNGFPRSLAGIATFCATKTAMSGAGITLCTVRTSNTEVAGSDPVCTDLQYEQSLLGEGPVNDAQRRNAVVVVADFSSDQGLWPVFAPVALRAGMQSVVALPLTAGVVRLGVLALYNSSAIDYSRTFVTAAVRIAGQATNILIGAPDSEASTNALEIDGESVIVSIVHQATGMIAAQLDCDIDEALVRLRGHAFAASQSVVETSRSIVQGKLRFK